MSRLARYLVPALLLAPVIVFGGQLLLVPVAAGDRWIYQRVYEKSSALHLAEQLEQGWPWPFLQLERKFLPPPRVAKRVPRPAPSPPVTRTVGFSPWLLAADLVALIFIVAAAAGLLARHYRRRGWLRFSLLELLAIMTIVALGFGWWMGHYFQWRQEEQLLARLTQVELPAGATVADSRAAERMRDILLASNGDAYRWIYAGPQFLRRLWAGADLRMFIHPQAVRTPGHISGKDAGARLAALEELAFVDELQVACGTPLRIGDARALRRIESIYFRRGSFDDISIALLPKLPRLRLVMIQGPINEGMMAALATCPQLEELGDCSDLDIAVLAVLARRKTLRRISLYNAEFSDDLAATIAQFKQLEHVDIRGNSRGLTEHGLRMLADLPRLSSAAIQQPPELSLEFVQVLRSRIANLTFY